jgi:GH24 family phage-related lysozyme (muramidase)
MKISIAVVILSLLLVSGHLFAKRSHPTWPVGGIYTQVKTMNLISTATWKDRTYRLKRKATSFFKIIAHYKGWGYRVVPVDATGKRINRAEYIVSKKWFHRGVGIAIVNLTDQLKGRLTKIIKSPTSPNCQRVVRTRPLTREIPPIPTPKPKLKPTLKVSSKRYLPAVVPVAPVAGDLIQPKDFVISENAIQLIKSYEGCVRCGYADVAQFSIGYGTHLPGNWKIGPDSEYVANNQCLTSGTGCTIQGKPGYNTLRLACKCVDGAKAEASNRMHRYLNNRALLKFMKREIKVPLKQHQIDALVSWYYNLGMRRYNSRKDSPSFIRLLNEGKLEAAAQGMTHWRKSGGVVNKGLVKRRAGEHYLFLHGKHHPSFPFGNGLIDYYNQVSGLKRLNYK